VTGLKKGRQLFKGATHTTDIKMSVDVTPLPFLSKRPLVPLLLLGPPLFLIIILLSIAMPIRMTGISLRTCYGL
jgi:hypothetical protein